MRYMGKVLELVALAVVAMLLVTGGASATTLTSPPETTKVAAGTEFIVNSGSMQWDGWINPGCTGMTLRGQISNAGGSEATVSGEINQFEVWGCVNDTVIAIEPGRLELHATSGGNGTVTWSGAEITVLLHRTSFGAPMTTHCIFAIGNIHVGTITGSKSTKETAALDISTASIPKGETDALCGGESTTLTGEAEFSSPDYLDVDKDMSGTTLTSSTGTTALKAGAKIKAEAGSIISLHGSIELACAKSTLEGEISNPGGPGVTVKTPISSLTLAECGKDTVTVLKPGSLELHGTSGGNGTMTWSGAEITVQTHRTIFGFPVTGHCIYKPENTDIGTFTGSATTGGTATLDVGSASLPQVATDGSCGSTAVLTGDYKFTSPDYLDVD